MKKIIYLLFLFLFCFLCYIIYELTDNDNLNCLVIGDSIADNIYLKNNQNINTYNNHFINKDYRIIDLLHILKYNEEITINNHQESIYQPLKKSEIIILSVGMNDIYQKINDTTKNTYTYLNNMVNNMEEILSIIKKNSKGTVIVLGYYNITNKSNDLFTYLNYKMKRITEKQNYIYLNLNTYLKENEKYLIKNNNFLLNKEGYYEINKLIVENLKKN